MTKPRPSEIRRNSRPELTTARRDRLIGRKMVGAMREQDARLIEQGKRMGSGVRGMVKTAHYLAAKGRITREQEKKLIELAGTCHPAYWNGAKRGMIQRTAHALTTRHYDRFLRERQSHD